MELIGILVPAVIDLINRNVKNSDARFWISVVVCAVVGLGVNYLETAFAFSNPRAGFDSISSSILAIFGLAQISYKAVWEKSGLRESLGLNAVVNQMK